MCSTQQTEYCRAAAATVYSQNPSYAAPGVKTTPAANTLGSWLAAAMKFAAGCGAFLRMLVWEGGFTEPVCYYLALSSTGHPL